MSRPVRKTVRLGLMGGVLFCLGALPVVAVGAQPPSTPGERSGRLADSRGGGARQDPVVTAMLELDAPTAAAAVRGAVR
ncbi:MAG: hypothetical protein ACRC0L_06215, partial [Angustibacter sp.]